MGRERERDGERERERVMRFYSAGVQGSSRPRAQASREQPSSRTVPDRQKRTIEK